MLQISHHKRRTLHLPLLTPMGESSQESCEQREYSRKLKTTPKLRCCSRFLPVTQHMAKNHEGGRREQVSCTGMCLFGKRFLQDAVKSYSLYTCGGEKRKLYDKQVGLLMSDKDNLLLQPCSCLKTASDIRRPSF